MYTLTQKELTTLKGRLTKVVNSKDSAAIIKEVNRAIAIFEEKGYPDNWSNWQRAKDDATFALQWRSKVW